MKNPNSAQLAVLIDADNAQASIVSELLADVSRYGVARVKRIYGDWTTPNLKGWKEVLHRLAIQPVQQFSYTKGKNATDAAMIIDAMDLLHGGQLDGFCLVSSDSDFTRLATRIREAGLAVYGFGEKKTPEAFVSACDKFTYTEILRVPEGAAVPSAVGASAKTNEAQAPIAAPSQLKALLTQAIGAVARDDGWAALAAVGVMLAKITPSFDPRNYGFQKLGELVRKQPFVELKDVPGGEGSSSSHIHVRLKVQG